MALRLKDIYNSEKFTERFLLAQDGPDGNSTYPECWGMRGYAARAVDQAATLAEAKVKAGDRQAIIDTSTGREVWRGSRF